MTYISKRFNEKICSGLIEKVYRGASRALEEGGDFLEVVAMPLYIFHRNIQKIMKIIFYKTKIL